MKLRLAACVLFTILTTYAAGQKILVLSELTGKPVSDAAVLDNTGSIISITDRNGSAVIPSRENSQEICIRHFAFERTCVLVDADKETVIKLTEKVFDIGEFVVSANRWEENRAEVPNRIMVIESEDIKFRNPQTAADLLGITREVFIQKSQLGGGSPMIRGFAANRLLIVVDGVRMNNAIYREGNIQNVISLDPNVTESSEVIFGPGAFVYGSDAIGGVMDFHTTDPLLSGSNESLIKAGAFTRYSSANNEKTIHASVNLGRKKIALFTGITSSDFDDLRMGRGKYEEYLREEYVSRINGKDSVITNSDPHLQKGSGYRQHNTTVKIKYRLSEKADLIYSNHWSVLSDVPRYDRLIQYKSGKPRFAEWYYGPQVWSMNSLMAKIKGEGRLFDELKIVASYQRYKESRHDRALDKVILNNQQERLNIGTLNLDFTRETKKGSNLYYGAEACYNDIISEAFTTDIETGIELPAGSRYPNGDNTYLSLSFYTGLKHHAGKNTTISTGIRYNFVSLRSTIADNSFYNFPFTEIAMANGALTGSAGIVYRLENNSQLNLNISTGFRAPNLDDAGKVFESAPGIVVVPNPGLKPEYAYNMEAGFIQRFGQSVQIEVTAFYTWLNNAMVRQGFLFNGEDSIIYQGGLSRVEAIVNAGYARVYGISSTAEVNIFRRFSLKTSFNLTEGTEKGGIPLRHAAPLFGTVHLVYKSPSVKADLYLDYNGSRKFEDMPPTEIAKAYMYAVDSDGNPWSPGWATLNFRVSADLKKILTINAGIENIFNVMYRPYSSGIVSPGRNFVISARVHI